jgi:hypothetical protein
MKNLYFSLFIKKISYLVDPASNHMLVLKTKPCKSKDKYFYRKPANGSLNQFQSTRLNTFNWITVVILELIHAKNPDLGMGVHI